MNEIIAILERLVLLQPIKASVKLLLITSVVSSLWNKASTKVLRKYFSSHKHISATLLSKFPELETLKISRLSGDHFNAVTNLKELFISDSEIEAKNLNNLTRIETLITRYCPNLNLNNLPFLENLVSLRFTGKINDDSKLRLSRLTRLESNLELSSLHYFPNLKALYCRNNTLQSLFISTPILMNLIELSLAIYPELPQNLLLPLTNLIKLDLGASKIYQSLTTSIETLTNLRSLTLPSMQYYSWTLQQRKEPQKIPFLTQLTELDLSAKEINAEGIQFFTNLKKLNLSNGSFVNLNGVSLLTNLTSVSMSGYNYASRDLLHNLTQIRRLDISSCSLVVCEDNTLSKLTNLTRLDISENPQISGKSLSHLTQLVSLRMVSKRIEDDTAILQLKKLSYLCFTVDSKISVLLTKKLPNLKQVVIENESYCNRRGPKYDPYLYKYINKEEFPY